jgi:4-hydroxy-2-oxoheptanedioate aldolase
MASKDVIDSGANDYGNESIHAEPNGHASKVTTGGMEAYAAPSLFQPHNARQAIRDAYEGRRPPLLGYYAGLSSVVATRWLAPFGFDTVWIDWEHTSCNVETMTTMVHEVMFMSGGRTIPFVRIPGHDHAAIGFALDAGASIVVPQVETVEQAQHMVSASKFGTKQGGTRSAPPFRYLPGITDQCIDSKLTFHENLNNQAAIMIQIESLQGIKNLDAILTQVPDIDIVWLGTLDARVSMNLPGNGGMGGEEPEWLEAVTLFETILQKHNKPRGGFAFPPPIGTAKNFKEACEKMSFCTVSCDVVALLSMGDHLRVARKTASASPKQ